MPARPLRIGGYVYEHTQELFEGRVAIEGVEARFGSSSLVSDVFRDMIDGRYDVAELGLTYFLRTWDTAERPFVALPVFPNRNFRHSAVYVRAGAGIETPADLAGRTVGEFALYGHDAGVWPKGILHDDYGVAPESMDWVIGGTDHPIPAFDWLPQPVPEGVSVRHAPEGATLAGMLEAGELDALFSVDVPQSLLDGSPTITRLFPDYERVERDYYARTGIFPIMHVIAIRRELAAEPGLVDALYQAYSTSKHQVQQRYLDNAGKQHMAVVNPWFSHLFARNRELMGDDWWPYGMARNRRAVDTFLRYHHEQGLSRNLLTSDEIFVPELMGT